MEFKGSEVCTFVLPVEINNTWERVEADGVTPQHP
jgi:hypothetical protein